MYMYMCINKIYNNAGALKDTTTVWGGCDTYFWETNICIIFIFETEAKDLIHKMKDVLSNSNISAICDAEHAIP